MSSAGRTAVWQAGGGPGEEIERDDWRLVVHDVLPSTSDLCRARAAAGEPAGLAVLARRQTQGRGSRGRGWESPPGNLYLSALLRPAQPAREAGQWSLLAGLALVEALAAHLSATAPLALKWPNDVLLGGRKLAGILIDSAEDGHGALAWVVIGMGANLAVAPEVPGRVAACLAEFAPAPDPLAFAWTVLARLAHWQRVRSEHGFAAIRAGWLSRAPAPGAPVAFRLGERVIEGAFAGLGEDGSLLLATARGIQAFGAGEVLL